MMIDRFDKVRIPRENLLNAVADVTPDGRYESAIKDPDQVLHSYFVPIIPKDCQHWLLCWLSNSCHTAPTVIVLVLPCKIL